MCRHFRLEITENNVYSQTAHPTFKTFRHITPHVTYLNLVSVNKQVVVLTKTFQVKLVTEFVSFLFLTQKKQKIKQAGEQQRSESNCGRRQQLTETDLKCWRRSSKARLRQPLAPLFSPLVLFPIFFFLLSSIVRFILTLTSFIFFFIVRLSITVLELTRLCNLLFTSASVTIASCWEIAKKPSIKYGSLRLSPTLYCKQARIQNVLHLNYTKMTRFQLICQPQKVSYSSIIL